MEDCLVWTGATSETGYGRRWVGGRSGHAVYVHRHAWEQAHGPIPDGMFVLHRCDNPPCYNIDHLFLGTHQDNMDDMVAKGRYPTGKSYPRGPDHHATVLTEDDVREIRRRRAEGGRLREIAAAYGVTESSVSGIAKRRTWDWLD